jgi:hypothetical protein
LAISLDEPLADEIQRAAQRETEGNVSAWLSEAARQRLRQTAALGAVRAYEAEAGVITEEELAAVRSRWPRG